MKGKRGISARTIKRFLQLAATTFAVGFTAAPALADSDRGEPTRTSREDSGSATLAADEAALFQHRFALPAPTALASSGHRGLADLRVIDASGRKVMQIALDGDSMVGPLANGSYTVLLRARGLTDVQRIRIAPGMVSYLHFTTSTAALETRLRAFADA